eukprot:10679130-Prorocentrum_lima.AAC.1
MVVQALDLVSVVDGRRLTLWFKSGDTCELLMDLKRRGDLFYLTRAQFDLIRQAMFTKKGKSNM